MRKSLLSPAAAAVALVFSALSVAAGARVLAGIARPDYVVLPWLPTYNVAAGIAGVPVAVGLWRLRGWAIRSAWALAAAHGAVLMALTTRLGTGGSVAADSVGAMVLRTTLWASVATVTGRRIASRSH